MKSREHHETSVWSLCNMTSSERNTIFATDAVAAETQHPNNTTNDNWNGGGTKSNAPNTSRCGGGGITNHVQTTNNTFEGIIPKVGVVIGLSHEKLTKKDMSFEVFLDKVPNYVISNLKDGGDAKPLFRKMENSEEVFKNKKRPEDLTNSDDIVEKNIYQEQIKMYVGKNANLRSNMEKSFGVIWGQCSSGLQTKTKRNSEYDDKYDDLNVL